MRHAQTHQVLLLAPVTLASLEMASHAPQSQLTNVHWVRTTVTQTLHAQTRQQLSPALATLDLWEMVSLASTTTNVL